MARRKRKQKRLSGLGEFSLSKLSTMQGIGLIAGAGALAYFLIRSKLPSDAMKKARDAYVAATVKPTKSLYE